LHLSANKQVALGTTKDFPQSFKSRFAFANVRPPVTINVRKTASDQDATACISRKIANVN